ncbi:MAG TPA: outer membrane beta-barrel protein [Dongiaceae bacterium]|jgi:hypothetical protein|nr:outer membrane beta-barrel protein [Dongiaceae bacterium]
MKTQNVVRWGGETGTSPDVGFRWREGSRYWLLAVCLLFCGRQLASAQEGLRDSMAGVAAAEARQQRGQNPSYMFKAGDFRMSAIPSLGMHYNDNINTVNTGQQSDFILTPELQLNASYPITQYHVLDLSIGFGYDKYLDHDNLDTWRLTSGSEVSFDIYIKDVWINLHDRVHYSQDSAQEASLAGTANYGNIENTAGLSALWDMGTMNLSAGYDHANTISPTQTFQSQDSSTEILFTRYSLGLAPGLQGGLEGTATFTTYDQAIRNNSSSYSVGVFADWQPGSFLRIQPRAGYTIYQFDKTSLTSRTSDLNSWYVDLTLDHSITKFLNYTLSAGHEVRLGIQSDVIEDWYVRPNLHWSIIQRLALNTYLSYEHGKQGVGDQGGNLNETYDWMGGGVGLSYPLFKRVSTSLSYRGTIRSSTDSSREYTQHVVGLVLTYEVP